MADEINSESNRDLELEFFNKLSVYYREESAGGLVDIKTPYAKILYVWLAFNEMLQKQKTAGGFTFHRIIPQCLLDSEGRIFQPGELDIGKSKYVLDFMIETVGFYHDPDKSLKIALEIDAREFQKKALDQMEKTQEKENFLIKHGFVPMIVKGSEIFDNPDKVICRMEELYWGTEKEELKRRKLKA